MLFLWSILESRILSADVLEELKSRLENSRAFESTGSFNRYSYMFFYIDQRLNALKVDRTVNFCNHGFVC